VDPYRVNTSVAMDYTKRIYFPPTATAAPHVVLSTNTSSNCQRPKKKHGRPTVEQRAAAAAAPSAAYPTKRLNKVVRPWKRAKKNVREAAVQLMRRIGRVDAPGVSTSTVYDSRTQIIQKVRMRVVGRSRNFKRFKSTSLIDLFLHISMLATDPRLYGASRCFQSQLLQ
jgi:hypothetical protein